MKFYIHCRIFGENLIKADLYEARSDDYPRNATKRAL